MYSRVLCRSLHAHNTHATFRNREVYHQVSTSPLTVELQVQVLLQLQSQTVPAASFNFKGFVCTFWRVNGPASSPVCCASCAELCFRLPPASFANTLSARSVPVSQANTLSAWSVQVSQEIHCQLGVFMDLRQTHSQLRVFGYIRQTHCQLGMSGISGKHTVS